MRRSVLSTTALLLTTLAGVAAGSAAGLQPLEPQFVSVGGRDTVLYYTNTPMGYEVVVTFAANTPDNGMSMRSVTTLAPGQQSTLSIGGGVGAKPATLTIRRDGDTLVVLPPEVQTAAR